MYDRKKYIDNFFAAIDWSVIEKTVRAVKIKLKKFHPKILELTMK